MSSGFLLGFQEITQSKNVFLHFEEFSFFTKHTLLSGFMSITSNQVSVAHLLLLLWHINFKKELT